MNETQWRDFLHKLSGLLLEIDLKENPLEYRLFSPEDHARGYVGFDGAPEEQIATAETRLGARLPNSYRAFLKVSNGWPRMGDCEPGRLCAVEEIQWVKDHDPFGIVDYGLQSFPDDYPSDLSPEEHLEYRKDPDESDPSNYRMAYVDNLLGISEVADNCQLLVSPEVLDEDEDWECWQFASWLPGALRYQNFERWMLRNYDFLEKTSES